MCLAVKSRFLGIESSVGWIKLPQITAVTVPDHPTFDRLRQNYLEQRTDDDIIIEQLFEKGLNSQGRIISRTISSVVQM